uniref:Secernin 3 n=1 Tax=Oncorhynchus kisutch TaxID=8019 RepID=A0A8C7I227_ONCKI
KLTYMCIKVVKSLVFGPIFIAPKNYIKLVTTNLLDILHGGNRMEDQSGFAYHNKFFLLTICCILYISNQYSITTKIDKEHPGSMPRAQTGGMSSVSEFSFTETYSFMTTARIDTSGSRYCGYLGHNTAEAMMDILRDKENGINMEGIFMATGSMVITGTPDPERSVFKPFVFVKDIKQLKQNSSLGYGPDDTVKKIPCFQSKPHRKHPLFVKHDVDMLKQHLKTSVRKLKNGPKFTQLIVGSLWKALLPNTNCVYVNF